MTLTPSQHDQMRRALGERRDALLAELRRDAARVRAETYGEVAGEAPDRADESVADLIADLDQAELSRDLVELREVDAALARLADGSYGRCVDCRAGIDFARLGASPAAARCAACQARHEKKSGARGGASL